MAVPLTARPHCAGSVFQVEKTSYRGNARYYYHCGPVDDVDATSVGGKTGEARIHRAAGFALTVPEAIFAVLSNLPYLV